MNGVLNDFSEAIAGTVAKAGPSVVRIEGRRRLAASGVVWSADGAIATAHHVLESDKKISVGVDGGKAIPATLVGRDPSTDVAVLKVDSKGLPAPTWSSPDALQVGHLALALGRPGKSVRATLGIVSALGDAWRTPAGGRIDRYLQTDLVMYPGFSGGPLVDASGSVLGINTSALWRGSSLAIPTPTLERVVETLLAHGKVSRGFLGVGVQPVRLPEGLASQLGQETGLLVSSLETGSPADKGGLLLGDIVVRMGDEPTRHVDDLLGFLTGDTIGRKVPVNVVRGGKATDVPVTIDERS